MQSTIITVLGAAGYMGRGIVRDLVSDRAICDIAEIRICDLDPQKLQDLIEELADPRLRPWLIDVRDGPALKQSLDGASLCINSVPTMAGLQMKLFEASLDAGVDYMDLGGLGVYTVKQLEWRDRFRDAGVTAVLGAGADPGLSNVICRAVADQLDTLDKINLYWAAELVGEENPVLVPPYSVSTVLAEYAHPSTQFLDGKHVECPPMSGSETIDLPDPWGRTEFIHSPHSEQLTVPLSDGIRQKGIREFTWKLHLPHREHEAWVGLIKAGFGDFDDTIEVGGCAVKPVEFLDALISRNMQRNRASYARPGELGDPLRHCPGHQRGQTGHGEMRCRGQARPDVRALCRRLYFDECLHRRAADPVVSGPPGRMVTGRVLPHRRLLRRSAQAEDVCQFNRG